jgi:superfamily II DNA or RNA helicase
MAEALDEYRQHRGSRLAAVYCVNLAHARQVNEVYTAAGVRVALITGDTCDRDRHEAFEALQSRRLEALINCAVLTEGIDLPELDLIQCLRPTLSLCLWRQMLGRGSRRASGKLDCLVLDHADNTRRHGLPDSEPAWSLDGRNPNLRAVREHHEITRCPRCGRLYGPGVHHCEECGSALPVVLDGRLVELHETSIFA